MTGRPTAVPGRAQRRTPDGPPFPPMPPTTARPGEPGPCPRPAGPYRALDATATAGAATVPA